MSDELVKRLRDFADGPDGTAPDGGTYLIGRALHEAADTIESLQSRLAAMDESIVVRLGLLEAYLDLGDISSVRSAIDAWRDAARSEGEKHGTD